MYACVRIQVVPHDKRLIKTALTRLDDSKMELKVSLIGKAPRQPLRLAPNKNLGPSVIKSKVARACCHQL